MSKPDRPVNVPDSELELTALDGCVKALLPIADNTEALGRIYSYLRSRFPDRVYRGG